MAWYFRRGNQAFGPIGYEELRLLARRGTVDKRTLLQSEGLDKWVPAESLVPNIFDTPPPTEGAATPVRYGEVFPEQEDPGRFDSAESVNFSSGGFGELDAFVDEMTENVDISFSSDAEGGEGRYATPAHATPARATPTHAAPVRPAGVVKQPSPTHQAPQKPVREEDSKAVCFGCGRLMRKVELTAYKDSLICSECRERLSQPAQTAAEPVPEPRMVESRLTEWLCEGAATLIALAVFMGFFKGNGRWMLAAAPLVPAMAILAACLCGGLDHAFGRRMLAVTVLLWLGALALYLPRSTMAPVVLLAGRGVFIWALAAQEIRKKSLITAFCALLAVSILAGILIVPRAPESYLILILVLIAADIVAASMSWGAWQGGASLMVALFGTLLYLWDAAAVFLLLRSDTGLVVPASLTVGMVALSGLAVLAIDQETGRPEGASRWPLRRENLPITLMDGVVASLAGLAVLVFAVLGIVRGPMESLFYVHCVLLGLVILLGSQSRLRHPAHVKWLLFAWGLAVLASRVITLKGQPLNGFRLLTLSKTYPVLHVGQLVHVLGGVALAYFACFHLERMLGESTRQWQKLLLLFLAVLGAFALREVVELPAAVAYPKLVSQSAFMAVFDLIFAGAGALAGVVIIRFQEK